MPVCRQCGKEWPEGYAVCPDDGIRMSVVTVAGSTGALAVATAPTSDEDLPAGSAAGEYVIETKLGEGGMGAVYGARHPVIGKRAAIKVIRRELSASTEAVDRFVREAQVVNQIGHPNIVDVFGFGRLADGRSFFVMEWLQGVSLRGRMERPLAFSQTLEVLQSIATALQAAHEAGVVHRDLKPDNVFLAQVRGADRPQVKLLDFGLAKLSGTSEGRIDHTRTGVVMGTPLYLSPEQAKGVKVDSATDVYSLGALAYEMASGQVPFMADSAVEIMAMHISAQARPITELAPWIPQDFARLVQAMLDKDPRRRPPITEVCTQLTQMRAQPAIANAAPVPVGQPAQWTPPPAQASDLARAPVTPARSLIQSSPNAADPSASALSHPAPRGGRGLVIGIVGVLVLAGIGAFALTRSSDTGSGSKVAAAQPEPTKSPVAAPEPTKPEPTKSPVVAPEPPKPEPTKSPIAAQEPPKPEPAKPEPVKSPVAAPEPPKPEPAKPEPGKPARRLGTVALSITGAPRATVVVDGKVMARDVSEIALELPAGEHVIKVEAPQHRPAETRVRIEPGGKRDVKLELHKKSINVVHDPFAD